MAWVKDLVITFLVAAFFYYVVLTTLLGTSSPFVTILSCSMKGHFNIGDMAVVGYVNVEEVNAPLLEVMPGESPDIVINNNRAIGVLYRDQTINFTKTGDIIVYNSMFRPGEPIIHRAVLKIKTGSSYSLLTMGDANPTIDQDCNYGECVAPAITQDKVVGKVLFHIPLLGHAKLLLTLGYRHGLWC
jgi:signal peptidase I